MGLFKFLKSGKDESVNTVSIEFTTHFYKALSDVTESDIKDKVISDLSYRVASRIEYDSLASAIAQKALEGIDTAVIQAEVMAKFNNDAEFRSEIATRVVESFRYDMQKLADVIDWSQLTPALSALVTKELAEKMFRGYR